MTVIGRFLRYTIRTYFIDVRRAVAQIRASLILCENAPAVALFP
jgi:hypothetical protein